LQGERGRRGEARHIRSGNLLLPSRSRAADTIGRPSLDCERPSISLALTSHKMHKAVGSVGNRMTRLAVFAVFCSKLSTIEISFSPFFHLRRRQLDRVVR